MADTKLTDLTFANDSADFYYGVQGGVSKKIADQEIFNVKTFGALGNGSHDDTTNIQDALDAMWATTSRGGILFFPPGNYRVTDTIDITNREVGSNFTSGRIIGSGKNITFIGGAVDDGFIFYHEDELNGPGEIGHLTLSNTSTLMGTGAMLLNNTGMEVHDCHFSGTINVLMPYNIFGAEFNRCTGSTTPDSTYGYAGTVALGGYGPHVKYWRSTACYQFGLAFWGANGTVIDSTGIENSSCAVLLGGKFGWASACTVSGDTLTVGGTLGATQPVQFGVGAHIFMDGLTPQTWGANPMVNSGCRIIANISGSGGAGTYQLSESATISSPVPAMSFFSETLTGVKLNSLQTEACYYGLYVNNISAGSIEACGAGGTPTQCSDVFGNLGYCSAAGIYVKGAAATTFSGCTPANNPYGGSFFIDPDANLTAVSFVSCQGQKLEDIVTANTATISNGSGGSGRILNIPTVTSGSAIGVGMSVTGTGVTAGTVIDGNHTTDNTLTGTGGAGTYRVNNAHNLSARVFTIHTGADWVLPTATASKTGLKFVNCNSANLPAGYTSALNSPYMTFTSLPGQAGGNTNVIPTFSSEYWITDGAKSGGGTAAMGDATQGSGVQTIRVAWNGTNWIRTA